jgi:hypothetical protein
LTVSTLASVLSLVLLLAAGAMAAEEIQVAVIGHPSRTDAISVQELRRIYLRQQRFWGDRDPILPVNREYRSPIRRAFETAVLGPVRDTLARYWNEQYFQGVLPPPTLESDSAVRQYVAARRNAVGYIDAGQVDASVRVLLRLP